MVFLDVDMVVDLLMIFSGKVVLETKRIQSPRGVCWCVLNLVVLPANVVPCCGDANSHVVETPLRDSSVEDSNGEVCAPVRVGTVELDITRHSHIQTSQCTAHSGVGRSPIADDKA